MQRVPPVTLVSFRWCCGHCRCAQAGWTRTFVICQARVICRTESQARRVSRSAREEPYARTDGHLQLSVATPMTSLAEQRKGFCRSSSPSRDSRATRLRWNDDEVLSTKRLGLARGCRGRQQGRCSLGRREHDRAQPDQPPLRRHQVQHHTRCQHRRRNRRKRHSPAGMGAVDSYPHACETKTLHGWHWSMTVGPPARRERPRRFGASAVGYHVLSMRVSGFGSAVSRLDVAGSSTAVVPAPGSWDSQRSFCLRGNSVEFRRRERRRLGRTCTRGLEPRIAPLDQRRAICDPIRIGSRVQPTPPVGLRKPPYPGPVPGFLAAARLRAPDRYPRLRTIYALSYLPAFVVIWRFPTAPPRWLPVIGLGHAPSQSELSNTLGALFKLDCCRCEPAFRDRGFRGMRVSVGVPPLTTRADDDGLSGLRVYRHRRNRQSLRPRLRCRRDRIRTRNSGRAADPSPISRRASTRYADVGRRYQAALESRRWLGRSSRSAHQRQSSASTAPGLVALTLGLTALSRPWNTPSALSSSESVPPDCSCRRRTVSSLLPASRHSVAAAPRNSVPTDRGGVGEEAGIADPPYASLTDPGTRFLRSRGRGTAATCAPSALPSTKARLR